MYRPSLSLIFFLLIYVSCKQEEKPLTKEEAMAFGKKLELSIEIRDGKLMDDAIDAKNILKKSGMESQNSQSFQQGMSIGTKLVTTLTARGSYSLIRHYEKEGIQHLLFRLYDNGMINYHDLELNRREGKPKIADVYIYLTGENLSETLKSLMGQFDKEVGKSPNEKDAEWLRKMPQIRTLIQQEKHRDALDIYNAMPAAIKKGRTLQILHVEICSGLSDEEYDKAIREYETLYPNEPNMHLLLIDGYILRKDYNKALKAVNELDKMINTDPLLDFHRAMCYTLMGDDARRVEHLERLVKNVPQFEDGILELLVDYLDAGQFDKARPLVKKYKSRSAFDQSRLDMLLEMYPDYLK